MKHLIAPLLIAISFPVFADEMTTTRGFPTPRSIERDGRMTQLMAIDVGGTTEERLFTAPDGASAVTLDQIGLTTRPTDFGDEVRIGRRSGVTGFTKFSYREGLTAAAGEETVWATTGNFTPMTTASTFTVAYTQANDGASAEGAKTLYCQYVDSAGEAAAAVHTLGSDGSDETAFSGFGINRCAVSSSGTSDTNVSAINITATTGGTTQAVIPAGVGVTQQAIYFTASNADAVASFLYINVAKATSGGSPIVTVKAYVYNRNVDTRFEVFRTVIDTGTEQTVILTEPVGFNLSPTDVLYWVADTNTNNATAVIRFSLREYERPA